MSRAAARNPSQRAEVIRQRRTTRSQSRLERAAHNLTSAAAPRVTVRGSGMGKPILQRTASRPRRVYTVALQNSGRAYSIPAPTIRLGWRAISGLLVIGLVALLGFLLSSDQFQVVKPTISGATRVSANDIESVLKLNKRSIFSINPGKAALDLEKSFPELQGIAISVGLPNNVSVRFSERQPVLAWQQKDLVRWIDASGMLFNARGKAPDKLATVTSTEAVPLYLPAPTPGPIPTADSSAQAASAESTQVAADPAPDRMDLQILTSALLLSNQMPAKANLIYSSKEGLGWHDGRGWDVYFGSTLDDLEKKISVYQAIIAQLDQKKIKPTYVNLEFLHAPYYRLEH